VREVGKAMGLSEDIIAALSSQLWGWGSGGPVSSDCARSASTPPTAPVQTMPL
jgi:hypothetical protein